MDNADSASDDLLHALFVNFGCPVDDYFKTIQQLRNYKRELDRDAWRKEDGQAESIRLWVNTNSEKFFFYQEHRPAFSSTVAVPFALGVMTRWQLEMAVKLGHDSLLCIDATYGTNMFKVGLDVLVICPTTVAQHAVYPVAAQSARSTLVGKRLVGGRRSVCDVGKTAACIDPEHALVVAHVTVCFGHAWWSTFHTCCKAAIVFLQHPTRAVPSAHRDGNRHPWKRHPRWVGYP